MARTAAGLEREHRELDTMLGRFLTCADGGELEAAREAIAAFDEKLRLHTAFEEENVLAPASGRRLVPQEDETAEARLSRELRLEHVQIRELSAMMRRLLEERDLRSARRLFPSLARRWDAHTAREERAVGEPDRTL